jgi:RNA polymerase sigma-70 factor (ECF subfamily)
MTHRKSGSDIDDRFQSLRPSLLRLAYRMLGSVSEAEDIVQEAFLRWHGTDQSAIREPDAYLRRIVSRLCLDHLKSARHRRETYMGTWLPDPVQQPPADDVEDVTLPLMLALERLSPLERAAFLLHDVFGVSFDEIAETLGRTSESCRQLASRARAHVRLDRPRFPVPRDVGLQYAEAFFDASRNGELHRLREMLSTDVVVYADGGGKVPTTSEPVIGIDDVLELHVSLARLFAKTRSQLVRYDFINGLPGFISIEQGSILQSTALHIEDEKIVAVYVTRNPEKLQHLRNIVLQ